MELLTRKVVVKFREDQMPSNVLLRNIGTKSKKYETFRLLRVM
jgi:hypothetical protein